jgi:hypothetical protein
MAEPREMNRRHYFPVGVGMPITISDIFTLPNAKTSSRIQQDLRPDLTVRDPASLGFV